MSANSEADGIFAWWFCSGSLRDGRPIPPDGETLRYDGPLVLCESGLHASERLIDALSYAPGKTLCRVRCGGEVIRYIDKLLCRERTILWRMEATALLHEFDRQCALDVVHLWDAPQVSLDYLETGDATKRVAAREAAREAARTATDATWGATTIDAAEIAWEAARITVAREAAEAAARTATEDGAADAVARVAADAVAREAARIASWEAASTATWEDAETASEADRIPAWATAWTASWIATWAATRTAAVESQNNRLSEMVARAAKDKGLPI